VFLINSKVAAEPAHSPIIAAAAADARVVASTNCTYHTNALVHFTAELPPVSSAARKMSQKCTMGCH